MADVKEVLVLFKTHLDLGFTDFAANILEKYKKSFIPQVFELRGEKFLWTTGSYIITEFLRTADDREREWMDKAVSDGLIAWHALPFTTHTELMTEELLAYGLSLSHDLDRRYRRQTRAAKMTDVPGHTRAMISTLASGGVSFLHLGKNPASIAPDVPPLFRWRDTKGAEITVMYDKDYGTHSHIPGTDVVVYFAHAGDNAGPPSRESLREVYAGLEGQFPQASIRAATLDDVWEVVKTVQDTLPVCDFEIGDTWIHGAGTDPKKVSGYRGLLRAAKDMRTEQAEKLYRELLPVPEHTWGLDEKTYLNDHGHFIRKEFESVRSSEPYRRMEKSWEEQRGYVHNALSAVPADLASDILAQSQKPRMNFDGWRRMEAKESTLNIGAYSLRFDSAGSMVHLAFGDQLLADSEHALCCPMYEAFCQKDYDRFMTQYLEITPEWAIEDNSKIGISEAIAEHLAVQPVLTEVYVKGNRVAAVLRFEGASTQLYGAPAIAITELSLEDGEILVDFAWWNKPASRVAEALWLGFHTMDDHIMLHKMGQWIDPLSVTDRGNRSLHGVEFGVKTNDLSIQTLDAALVAPGKPSLLNFDNEQPVLSGGVWFNLYNNVWGTNFPMWYDEDARFRFIIRW